MLNRLLLSSLLFLGGCCLHTVNPIQDECLDENGNNIGTDTCVGCTDDCLEPDTTLQDNVGLTTA